MISTSEKETQQLGISLAAQLRPGDVLLLSGDLGAGKTVFARGVARAMGITGPISSPTFALVNVHEGCPPLHHFDLYRLSGAEEFWAAGLDELIGGEAVSLIEWPERALEALPTARLVVDIAYGRAEGERIITITPQGGFREVRV